MRLDHILLGYTNCYVRAEHVACFLSLCGRLGIPYRPLHGRAEVEDGGLHVRVRMTEARALRDGCAKQGIDVRIVGHGGLPALVRRYRRRVGLLIGVALAAAVLFVATHTVWDVRIEGENGMPQPALRELLSDCGLSVGNWIPSLDTDAIEAKLLIESETVAWVSVNLKGTVASVQLRELLRPQSAVSDRVTNLVAECDGVIESVRLLAGQPVVVPGDVVRQGELLVSGVRDSTATGYGVEAAQGEVMARVEETLTVEIGRREAKKSYLGRQNGQKTLFFFGKTLKLSKKTTTEGQNCDIIKRVDVLSLPGGTVLPIRLETEVVRPYEWQEVTLSDEQLIARGYEALGRALASATSQAVLVSKQVTSELTDAGLVLRCRYECIRNIAVAQPLSGADGS